MTVVFCTYHSLPIVEGAQQDGAPPFDIIFCDEAHRTTGVEHPDDRTSPFVLVHNTDRIRANKRLYMTATPRIYTETARAHARNYERDVFSMDDPNTYGPEFHRLPFSKAVEIDELSDYKVVVLAISEGEVNTALRGDSVRRRARGIDNSAGRQKVLLELYENFFVTALKKEADRLGIVYTPIEVVDFILQSANEVLQDEFGRSLSDEGVHVLDPFTGTGTFLARLLQSEDLIQPHDLERKYRKELHANELVLLAYYIAAVNIEETFRGRRGEDTIYEPFSGIVLTDTFNLNKAEKPTIFPKEWLPDNNERAEHQQKLPIQVIVGNPPWSAKQRSASDDNPNVEYLALEDRVRNTYVERSTATLRNSLYDTYKMAIRWASDRIENHGVIAFITNGSWIDGNADSGVRACLVEEFSSIYVLHLRGNQRTQGEVSRREGGKVFGGGSRAPVAITILVKNPNATHQGCKIQYREY